MIYGRLVCLKITFASLGIYLLAITMMKLITPYVKLPYSPNISLKQRIYVNANMSNCSLSINLDPCRCCRTLHRDTSSFLKETVDVNTGGEQSTCSSWASLRGPAQKVVSYSVFGEFPNEYYGGVEQLVPMVAHMYPGWVMRLYVDLAEDQLRSWACDLACANTHLDLCDVSNLPAVSGTLKPGLGDLREVFGTAWRFCVVGDPLVEFYVVRDTDSPILDREMDAVNQWLQSSKCFHAMRDHPYHSDLMLAGMWGGCNTWQPAQAPAVRTNLLAMIKTQKDDQPALWKHIWPWAKRNILVHDSFNCKKFRGTSPFPSRRTNGTFVGMKKYIAKFENVIITKSCPKACRPAQHKDWIYC